MSGFMSHYCRDMGHPDQAGAERPEARAPSPSAHCLPLLLHSQAEVKSGSLLHWEQPDEQGSYSIN